MLRLSQRAWNNVLIISMLVLIVVLNFDKLIWQDVQSTRLIVPEGEYILSMQINEVNLQKAGQQWRINPNGMQVASLPSAQQLQAIVDAWQIAYVTPVDTTYDAASYGSPEVIVTLMLAGKSQATVVAFKIIDERLLLILNQQLYILNSPSVEALLSPIISVKS